MNLIKELIEIQKKNQYCHWLATMKDTNLGEKAVRFKKAVMKTKSTALNPDEDGVEVSTLVGSGSAFNSR